MRVMYKNFKIAGLEHYEALFVIQDIKVGDRVFLKTEKDNIHDENAVAVYFKDKKLGYIPRNANYSIAVILNANWNIFEAFVQRIDRDALEIDIAVFVKSNGE